MDLRCEAQVRRDPQHRLAHQLPRPADRYVAGSAPEGEVPAAVEGKFVATYRVATYHVVTYHVVTYHVATYRVATYRVATYHVVTYHVATYRVATYRVATYHVATYHVVTYHVATYRVATYRVATYHVATYRVATYRVAAYHVATYRVAAKQKERCRQKRAGVANLRHIRRDRLRESDGQDDRGHQNGAQGCEMPAGIPRVSAVLRNLL
ncbi:MAG: hypothetical protein KJ057_15230 [Phycisphaerae bacterium]|nr:hypothetical protein [Planctomycetia bacterium]MCL4719821.1 hypothetical protein [Phycisphaerae bacterium]